MFQQDRTTERCCRRCRHSVVDNVVCAEHVHHSLSCQLVVAHVVEASGGRVQDGLLHDDGDKAVVVVGNAGPRPYALDATMGDG